MRSRLVIPARRERKILGVRPERFAAMTIFLLSMTLLAYLGVLVWAYPLGAWGFMVLYFAWYAVSRLIHRGAGPS
jgi:hypothetical protein